LKKMADGHKTEHRLRMRAQVVLHAARGRSNARIARETGLHLDAVRRWRGRFAQAGLPGLTDRQRCGHPASFTPLQAAEVKALACRLPAETGTPLSRWSCPELAREAAARGIAPFVSASTVRRRLDQDAIKPWRTTPGSSSPPPASAEAARLLDLYARAMRVNHAYGRGGAQTYLAAYDVHRAKVFGRTAPCTGIDPFMNRVAQVMSQEPYASAKRVFWIVDNGSSHRGQKTADRLAVAFPNAVMVHTPVHTSWLNQVEIYFSVVQRKVVQPTDFTDLGQGRDRLRALEDRYNATAKPFQWKFTTSDLDDLLTRLDRHTADHPEEPSFRLTARSTPEGFTEPTT
jgi:transposase